jgi:hypothetical protein
MKTTVRVAGDSESAVSRSSENVEPGPGGMSMTSAVMISASPVWVIARYHPPAAAVSAPSCSVINRKYDVSDIASHISRNVRTLSASTTRLIVSRNRLSMAPSQRSE